MIRSVYKKIAASFALFTIELLLIWGLFVACVIVFFSISSQVRAEDALSIDQPAFDFARNISSPSVESFFVAITFLGSKYFLTPASLALVVYFLLIRKHRWHSLKVPVIALGSITLNEVLKYIFDRPRPIMPLVEASGLSFPSGHTMVAASFYGLLIYLVWKYIENKPLRIVLVIILSVFTLLIGFSRVYLRAHYASDVLAGFAAGLFWLVFGIWALQKIEKFSSKEITKELLSDEENNRS